MLTDGILINDELGLMDIERALGGLSPERRAYALSYRADCDRRLSVAVYLLLKDLLRINYGLVENPRLERGLNGKPFLPDHPEIHFNFSHCPKAAACIVSDRPVGIDVEEIASVDWAVARRVLSVDEFSEVRMSPVPEVTFASYWTRKEAFVKMTGDGVDDMLLPNLLEHTDGCRFETMINRERGYVLTTAVREDDIM